jgi:hypothetical protein
MGGEQTAVKYGDQSPNRKGSVAMQLIIELTELMIKLKNHNANVLAISILIRITVIQ